jgi:hypothetical protein
MLASTASIFLLAERIHAHRWVIPRETQEPSPPSKPEGDRTTKLTGPARKGELRISKSRHAGRVRCNAWFGLLWLKRIPFGPENDRHRGQTRSKTQKQCTIRSALDDGHRPEPLPDRLVPRLPICFSRFVVSRMSLGQWCRLEAKVTNPLDDGPTEGQYGDSDQKSDTPQHTQAFSAELVISLRTGA